MRGGRFAACHSLRAIRFALLFILHLKISNHNSQIELKHPKRWNPGTLKPWNIGTLKPSVKRKEIPFITHLSALHSKPNALRYTLNALRWNFETLEPLNFRNRSLIPYGENIMFWNVTSTNLHPLRGKSGKHRA